MALIDFITQIQFGAISLLRQQCEQVGSVASYTDYEAMLEASL
jgi:hypothetical protein